MRILTRAILIAAAALLVVGFVAIAVWDIPAPTSKIEKVLPDDRFPR